MVALHHPSNGGYAVSFVMSDPDKLAPRFDHGLTAAIADQLHPVDSRRQKHHIENLVLGLSGHHITPTAWFIV